MTTPRIQSMTEHLGKFLDRYSAPRSIINNPEAQQAEMDALLKTMLHFAPREGFEQFADDLFTGLSRSMRTRSWPTNGEMADACKDTISTMRSVGRSPDTRNVVALLTSWYERNGNQMPSMGSGEATAEMIRNGVFADEREARFRGFDLLPDDSAKAKEQRMGRAEWDHHCCVLSILRGDPTDQVIEDERNRVPVYAPEQPFRRSPVPSV